MNVKSSLLFLASTLALSGAFACSSDGTTDGGDGDMTATGGTVGGDGDGSGSGGTPGGDGDGGSDPNQFPADMSQATIEAFLTASTYSTWTAQDAAIRASDDDVNPHGDNIRVYFNDAAAANATAPIAGSMVVKELYDAGGTLLGQAVTMDAEDGRYFYCNETDGTTFCSGNSETLPLYNTPDDSTASCGFCHGPAYYAPLP